jgi:hypothetical protein
MLASAATSTRGGAKRGVDARDCCFPLTRTASRPNICERVRLALIASGHLRRRSERAPLRREVLCDQPPASPIAQPGRALIVECAPG